MPSGQGWGKYSKDTLSVPFYFIAVKIISRLLVELKVFKNIFNKEKTKCTFKFSIKIYYIPFLTNLLKLLAYNF